MNKNILKSYLKILISIFFVATLIYYCEDYKNIKSAISHINGDAIEYNIETGFYDHSLKIKLKKNYELPLKSEIYYTLNGDDPTLDSNIYTGSIDLELDKEKIKIYPIKAAIIYKNKVGKIYEKTYVVGENINDNINLDVISLTTDSYNLWDYYKGIFNPGYIFDQSGGTNYLFGNYIQRGEEWERPAMLTYFNSDGKESFSQNITFGVSGGTSSSSLVRSLKIIADDKNGEKINLVLNEDEYSDYTFINDYKSLRLHSGSQDYVSGANIRSAIVSRLAKEANFSGIPDSKRVILFLNNEFYGIFNIQETYSNYYLKNKFNISSKTNIYKIKGSEKRIFPNSGLSSDISDFEKKVDMNNYLQYNAIQFLVDNSDWPQNNVGIWKCDNENDNSIYCDNKYRFLLFDLDLIYNRYVGDVFFECESEDSFKSVLDGTCRAYNNYFRTIIKNEKYLNDFSVIMLDLMNTTFKKENIINIIDEEYDKIQNSVQIFYGQEEDNKNIDYILKMKQAVEVRNDEIEKIFNDYFNFNKKYEVNLKNNSGALVKWNNMEIFENSTYKNNYYKELNITYKYELYPNYKFKYWLVNGKKVDSKDLTVSYKDATDEKINIELITEKKNNELIIISEISASSSSDWFKIYNPTDKKIDLSNYYVTDNKKKLKKYQLPNIYLNPGETIKINGYKNYYSIGDYICNFNINAGNESLYIYSSKEKKVIDSVSVPRMSKDETYGRYLNSNKFVFFNNINKIR